MCVELCRKKESLPLEGKGDRLRWMRWKNNQVKKKRLHSQSTPHQSLRDSFPSRGSLKKFVPDIT